MGYGTDTQVRGTVAWEDRRVNRRGHRFRTEVKAAATEQSVDARYIVPIGDPAIEKFTMQLTGEHERQRRHRRSQHQLHSQLHACARTLVRATAGSA